jgi:uncharacterized membrane protein YedE/YeeE
MRWLLMDTWSPYAVGIGIGVLSWITFLISDKALGCSTTFSRASGMIERLLRGKKVMEREYYRKFAPAVDWQWMLVVGIVIGAFVSAKLSGEFKVEWVPAVWAARVGQSPAVRWVAAVLGGAVLGFGARWAGGCTSGHGISGALQLTISSWIAAVCFFIGGALTAMLFFKVLV